jgi:hypothetical protein
LKTVKSTTAGLLLVLQVLQVVDDVFAGGGRVSCVASAAMSNVSSRFSSSSPPAPQQRDPVHLHAHHQARQQRRPAQGCTSFGASISIATETPILTISHNMKLTALAPGDTLDRRLVMPRAIKAPGTTTVAAP